MNDEDSFYLRTTWDKFQEEYDEAGKDVREATERLQEARKQMDDHIRQILFGVD